MTMIAIYLIVGSNNELTINQELSAIENWAQCNNLKLNKTKSKEIIFYNNRKKSAMVNSLPTTPNLERVQTLKKKNN